MNTPDDNDEKTLLLQTGLAFFGTITASVSHELNNVISIIDQTNGLLEDLIAGAESGTPVTVEKLERVVTSIQKHAARGLKIITRLNKFAHSIDEPVREYDLNETVRNLADLAARFAGLKRVALEVNFAEEPLTVTGNPFFAQQALFAAIRLLLDDAPRTEVIVISTSMGESGVRVTVKNTTPGVSAEEFDTPFVRSLLDQARGAVDIKTEESGTVFRFSFGGGP
jgi:signal transduction histidine kinase